MLKNLKRENKGFTIIEVLIVLAIAGLIMLVVFMAVPALQRNSRNTQIRSSAAALLGGVSEFVSNNNGQQPTNCNLIGNDVTFTSSVTGTNTSTARVQGGYTVACGTTVTQPTVNGTLNVRFSAKCTGNNLSTTTTNRAVAVGFVVESGSATNPPQCVES